jgi:hypothetical protein
MDAEKILQDRKPIDPRKVNFKRFIKTLMREFKFSEKIKRINCDKLHQPFGK